MREERKCRRRSWLVVVGLALGLLPAGCTDIMNPPLCERVPPPVGICDAGLADGAGLVDVRPDG